MHNGEITDKTLLAIAWEQTIRKIIANQAALLIVKFGYWKEDENNDLDQWRYEVEHNQTRQGYWEWVFLQKDIKE